MAEQATKELRSSEHKFPVDVTAYDVAPDGDTDGYRFSFSKEKAIALIRLLADRIESGDYLLQGFESRHKLEMSDYAMNSWIITVAQKQKP